MKKLLTLMTAMAVASMLSAQATLPLSESFTTSPTLGAGWTTNTTKTYPQGQTGVAGRLDQDDDYFQVEFSQAPGFVTYYLRGFVGSGNWSGTFTIEESADSTNWTDMRVIDNSNPLSTSAYTMFVDTPMSTTRFVRWYYTDKISGANTALDEVTVSLPGPTPQQEINVENQGNTIADGSKFATGSAVSSTVKDTFWIHNLGTVDTLDIVNITLAGPQQAEFSITPTMFNVPALDSAMIELSFTPTMAGGREVTISILSNDVDENPYEINVTGFGGNSATEPASSATGLSFSNIVSYTMDVSWTIPGDAESVLVLYKPGSAVTATPTDGTEYESGDPLGDAKVFYAGSAASFTNNEFIANTDYHFAVFPYNGFSSFTNYRTMAPLSGSQTSGGAAIGTYYNGIDPNNATFVTDLSAKLFDHFEQFYSNYRFRMIQPFLSRDTSNGQRVLEDQYSGELLFFSGTFDHTASGYSREHVFAKDWMPYDLGLSTDALHEVAPGRDYHTLVPVNQDEVNAVRGTRPMGDVVNVNQNVNWFDITIGTDSRGIDVFEPRDRYKGDVARMLMYQAVAYDRPDTSWAFKDLEGNGPEQGNETLLLWHFQDPPDNWEIARNDFVDNLQNNRNPFVDNPEWVCYIDFWNMEKQEAAAGCLTSIRNPVQLGTVGLHPNPASDRIRISLQDMDGAPEASFRLYDLHGRLVMQRELLSPLTELNTEELPEGMYLYEVSGSFYNRSGKITILH